jgi:hypothetical protein
MLSRIQTNGREDCLDVTIFCSRVAPDLARWPSGRRAASFRDHRAFLGGAFGGCSSLCKAFIVHRSLSHCLHGGNELVNKSVYVHILDNVNFSLAQMGCKRI